MCSNCDFLRIIYPKSHFNINQGSHVRILKGVVVQKDDEIELIFDCRKDWEKRSYYFGEDSYHFCLIFIN